MVIPPNWQARGEEAELREMIQRSLMRMDMRANNMLMVGLVFRGWASDYLARISVEEEAKLPAVVKAYWEHECDDPACLAQGHGRV